jgi:exodeoxyribonuclease VII small subunit
VSVDDVLDRLEATIAKLAEGTAPIDRLVSAYEEATKLLEQAEKELAAVEKRLAEQPAD